MKKEENRFEEKRMNSDAKRIGGYAEVVVGVFLALAGCFMFYQTLGTRLLFLDAGKGKICGFFWLVWLISLIPLVIGTWNIKHNPKEKEVPSEELAKEQPGEQVGEQLKEQSKAQSDDRGKMICPVCGKENVGTNAFCIYCGGGLKK